MVEQCGQALGQSFGLSLVLPGRRASEQLVEFLIHCSDHWQLLLAGRFSSPKMNTAVFCGGSFLRVKDHCQNSQF
jgi:hypothetical protein